MKSPGSSLAGRATTLERYLEASVQVGFRGAIVVAIWFLFYVGFGVTADLLGWINLPYPFLSLEADPLFVIGCAVAGLFIVQGAGSLVLYHLLVGVEDSRSQLTVLWAFMSLGFGGALLRVTLPTAVQIILQYV